MKKLRPLGETLLDLELLLDEMTEEHHLQWGDILSLIKAHLEVHCPDSQEEYLDGSKPKFYYGPQE